MLKTISMSTATGRIPGTGRNVDRIAKKPVDWQRNNSSSTSPSPSAASSSSEASSSSSQIGRVFTREEADIASALSTLVDENRLDQTGENSLAVVYDMDRLEDYRNNLKNAFPDHWTHAFAIKAAPFEFFLRDIVNAGMGLEAASFLEVKMAEAAGCPHERIVFDSPAKTIPEIRYALEKGILLNCNSTEELLRAREAYDSVKVHPKTRIGVRLNPMVGSGAIASLSVSKADSKFGIIAQNQIIEFFKDWPALCGLHVHTGSQGMSVDQLAEGVGAVAELADRINASCGTKRITTVDIGGGLSTNYESQEVSPTFSEYADALRRRVPELFSQSGAFGGGVEVVTEFGRALCAKAGWVATGVEYLMRGDPAKQVAITHAGADLFVRPCYQPANFKHRFSAFTSCGTPLSQVSKSEHNYDIAGPLCFAGDVIGREVQLPELQEGDWIVIHDCGANTFSLWSRHCSRQAPPVFGVSRRSLEAKCSKSGVQIKVLKQKEDPESVIKFWQ